ncbi:MAG: HEAT repeat domain-containing protein [Planctomycetes bacterium]|nr:HEAT repeat domain-containing protein [Planctomycetota bacterium]
MSARRRSSTARAGLLALTFLCACAGAPRQPSSEARVVPLTELPAAHRAAWEAWLRGSAHFELERAHVERDPELARFVVDNLVRELVRGYERNAFARPGGEPGRFERAQADLVAFADASSPVLAELLRAPDGVVAFLCADRLVAIGARAVPHVTPLLSDARPETRRKAAELLGRLPHAGAAEVAVQEALAQRAEHDPEWPVRAEAARALGARGRAHTHRGYAMGVLLRVVRDPDRTVAASAAEGLALLGEQRAIPRLAAEMERAAGRGEPAVVSAIERALRTLAGDGKRRSAAEWRAYSPP